MKVEGEMAVKCREVRNVTSSLWGSDIGVEEKTKMAVVVQCIKWIGEELREGVDIACGVGECEHESGTESGSNKGGVRVRQQWRKWSELLKANGVSGSAVNSCGVT